MVLEADSSKCRRHPNQREIPGVCSSCLREKLAKLDASPSFNRRPTNFVSYSSSLSSTPPYSTASSSSTATGTRKSPGNGHRRNGSEAYVSVGMVLNDGLKKSRSVSCAPLSKGKLGGGINNIDCISSHQKVISGNNGKNKNNNNNIKDKILEDGSLMRKKSGFLKKLIHSTSKKTKGVLTHSKTMKERPHHASNNNNYNNVIITSITKNKN